MNLVITGSSYGIGRAIAEHLLAQGHCVHGVARSPQDDLVSRHNGRFSASRADVADWTQLRTAIPAWDHADGLITCAGIQGELGPALQADPVRWSATIRANLDGTFYALRAVHPLLARAPRRAKVVCFSGGGATKARANFSAYAAAKTAVVRLVETIAEENRSAPLDINAVAPGAINTRLTEEVLALGPAVVGEVEYQTALQQKAGGGGSLAKVLGLVDWLLSPASDGISGRLLAAPWDPWPQLGAKAGELAGTDVYTLRRILPKERGLSWE